MPYAVVERLSICASFAGDMATSIRVKGLDDQELCILNLFVEGRQKNKSTFSGVDDVKVLNGLEQIGYSVVGTATTVSDSQNNGFVGEKFSWTLKKVQ